jgi:hypothetical protein
LGKVRNAFFAACSIFLNVFIVHFLKRKKKAKRKNHKKAGMEGQLRDLELESSGEEEGEGGEGPGRSVFSSAGYQNRIHLMRILIRIRIQHFRLNTDPDPGFL